MYLFVKTHRAYSSYEMHRPPSLSNTSLEVVTIYCQLYCLLVVVVAAGCMTALTDALLLITSRHRLVYKLRHEFFPFFGGLG